MKTNQEIAKEIFQGKWGNNAERKKRLTEAGYDYEAIQSIVNAISEAMPRNEIIDACWEYDRQRKAKEFIVTGTEELEITVDLKKYNTLKLTFVMGEENG